MNFYQTGQYRCSCGWVLVLIPETVTLSCPNEQCENHNKQFQAPSVELTEVAQ